MENKSRRVLIAGKNGQVGSELVRALAGSCELLALGHGEMDLANPQSVREPIRQFRPDLIINAAAYTAVDQAERDEALAHAVNADAPGLMAEEAKTIGAALIHYSTDYVFDGSKERPYQEGDATNPISAYGRSKLAGERAIEAAGVPHLIFRTAWVYATRGKNFLLTILRLASEREELKIVGDQIGAPTWSRAIANATAQAVSQDWILHSKGAPFGAQSGVYHMTAGGQTSWYDFATTIIEEVRRLPHRPEWLINVIGDRPLIVKRVARIATADYPTPARRPAYSVLSNSLLKQTFGIHLDSWQAQLRSAIHGSFKPGAASVLR